jgi:CRP-like cAMP-binding protein/CheY-like chemotaxis protein
MTNMAKKIIVIEDNHEMRENISDILKLAHYEVIMAADGKQGITLIEQHLPDLVLCDIMMPELDGYGVLHILSKDPATAEIPFIFLTAKSEPTDFRTGMSLGADDYITKPFDGLDLLRTIEMRLKKSELLRTSYKNDLPHVNAFLDKTRQLKDFQRLSENRLVRTYRKKEFVFMDGQPPTDLYFVSKGIIKTYKATPDGKELITGLHGEGSFLGYTYLLENKPYEESAVAIEDAEVSQIPGQDFLSLIYTNKEIAGKFIKLLSNNLVELETRLVELAYQSVRQRVAGTLLKIVHQLSSHSLDADLVTLSRKDIAEMVGTATESLNRTLADFKEEGVILLLPNGIRILDAKKLRQINQ